MKKLILFSCVIINSLLVKAGDPDLFYFVADGDDHLYSVDRSTETVTDIGATGVSNIESIAYYPIPGSNQLFAANGGEFGELNLTTGAYTSISDIDATGDLNGSIGAVSVTDVDAMMLDGQTFIIWAAQRNSPNDLLFQIDPTTGQAIRSAFGPGVDYIVVSGPGINVDVDDIAVSPMTGRMYASNNDGGSSDNLVEINKYTATYTVITSLTEDDVEGMAFHNDGSLYGSEGDIDRMSEINLTTGAMTNQITLDGGDVEALASLVADANTISGTVYNDDDLDATLDGGESGVEGVTVYLYFDTDGDGAIDPEDTRLQTTTTDANGEYVFYYASTASLLVTTEFSSYPASSALTTDNIESATFTDNVNFAEVDSGNDFGIGTGADCDGDGLPNFFESNLNSDNDPILDSCDLDSDNDGIRDDIEGIEDFDNDGIPNYRDRDSDDDGIPDAIEAFQGAEPTGYSSSEGNVSGTDSDGNGIVDNLETSAGSGVMLAPLPDSDNDGNPDYLDLDSDNDGILDIIEAGGEDSDQDGQVDGLIDTDSNGLDDRIEDTPLEIPNTDESFENTNGLTNLPNYIDIDSDSDGIDDTREGYSTADYDFPTILTDTDSDGIVDFWDVSTFAEPISPYDRDSDDIPDYIDSDSDNDGVSDLIEGNDADGNGVVDVTLSGDDDDNNGLDDALDGLCGEETFYATANDFAEEDNSDGSVDVGSSDLELVNETNNQTVGIRFTNIELDQGETITSAYVQFEVDELSSGSISIVIEGELATNSAAFSDTDNDVTSRTTTTASEIWTPGDWTQVNETGENQRTVDISSIIQEIVDQGGWSNGNSLSLIFSGPTGNTRIAEVDPLIVISTTFNATPTLNFTAGDYSEEDNSDGSIDLGSSDLELPNDGGTNQTVGILFSGVTLEQGQVVTSAHIQFEADEVRTGAITVSIEGELANSAAAFTSTAFDVSSRTTTTSAAVSWSPADWNTVGEAGVTQQTPDISTLVQEIVNQSGWTTGNNMVFIITGPSGNRRTAETDPVLVIETTASFSICASNVAHQDFDSDGEDDFRDTDDDNDGISTFSEIPDSDGSGQPDYLEFDGDECGTGSILTSYTDDYTAVRTSSTGVANNGNLLGTPNTSTARFDSDNDVYIIDFEQIYPAGYKYVITWQERTGQSGTAEIVLAESDDNSTFNGRLNNPTTNSTTLFNDTITSLFDFQYLRFQLLNSVSSTDFEIDAVGVLVPNCADDSDDDGIANTVDIDDDNDGILDVDETGDTDGDGIPDSEDLDSDNDGVPDIQEAGGTDNDGDGRVDDPADNDGDGWADTFDSDDGGTALDDDDKDGDGLENRIDLDADDDGIADIIEAGGEDTDGDGRVDDDTDTDGDGFADTFDNDNLGTPLPIEDEDGDGIQNYLDLDSDSDGIIDNVEGQTTADFRNPDNADFDNDGWDDEYDGDVTGGTDGTPIVLSNNEGFGNPDYLDADSDGDGFPDYLEGFDDDLNGDAQNDLSTRANNYETAAGNPLHYDNSLDTDGDNLPDWLEDDDGDNVVNFLDPDNALYIDTDNDGLVNLYDTDNNGVASALPDQDSDGNPDFRDTDNTIVSLPIVLRSFNAIKVEDKVELTWVTTSEINNDYFVLERLNERGEFEAILTTKGAGNSNVELNYKEFDYDPLYGLNYYRLKQVDFDGQYDYSHIEKVWFNSSKSNAKLFPNPGKGNQIYLAYNAISSGMYEVNLFSAKGNLIAEKQVYVSSEQGSSILLWEELQLPAGYYYFKIKGQNDLFVLKYILQK